MGYLLVAAAAASTFNLTCTGTMESLSSLGKEAEAWEQTFRVDLDQGKWCEGECKALHDFANVGPTQLTFQDKRETMLREEGVTSAFVSRETGAYHGLASHKGSFGTIVLTWKGQCEAAPFAGFPEFATKF